MDAGFGGLARFQPAGGNLQDHAAAGRAELVDQHHAAVGEHRQDRRPAGVPDDLEVGAPAVGQLVLLDGQGDDAAAENDHFFFFHIS